jgi:LAS superfamily LD-carboxypeptidase LdcB
MRGLLILGLWGVFTSFQTAPTFYKNDLLGKFDPATHPAFVSVPNTFASKEKEFVRAEVWEAFQKMAAAAKQDGLDMIIVSGTRNHAYQTDIWQRKWNTFPGKAKEKAANIMTYSSMPGTSRHHWGTDIDINSVEPVYFESGYGAKLYAWLDANAFKFGFFQPYKNEKAGRKGFKDEKWHWSYYPTARKMLQAFNRVIAPADIAGFDGADLFEELHVGQTYINGIAPEPRLEPQTPWK